MIFVPEKLKAFSVFLLMIIFIFILISLPSCAIRSKSLDNDLHQSVSQIFIKGTSFKENKAWILTDRGELNYIDEDLKTTRLRFEKEISQFHFMTGEKGWLIDVDSVVWKTIDSGLTWAKLGQVSGENASNKLWRQMYFEDESIGFLISPFSVQATTDGGKIWKEIFPNENPMNSELESEPLQIFAVDRQNIWVSMTDGKIIKTQDGGKNWSNVSLVDRKDVNSVWLTNKDTGCVGTWSRGGLFCTRDGGSTWNQRLPDNFREALGINSVIITNNDEIWFAGKSFPPSIDKSKKDNAILVKSADGGQTWKEVETALNENEFRSIVFIDENNGWLVGERTVNRTYDRGQTWKQVFQIEAKNETYEY